MHIPDFIETDTQCSLGFDHKDMTVLVQMLVGAFGNAQHHQVALPRVPVTLWDVQIASLDDSVDNLAVRNRKDNGIVEAVVSRPVEQR